MPTHGDRANPAQPLQLAARGFGVKAQDGVALFHIEDGQDSFLWHFLTANHAHIMDRQAEASAPIQHVMNNGVLCAGNPARGNRPIGTTGNRAEDW